MSVGGYDLQKFFQDNFESVVVTLQMFQELSKFGQFCGGGRGHSPLGILSLMILIDHSDGLRQAFGTWVFKKTCTLMVCDVPLLKSSPSLGEVLHESQSNLHFDTRLLCYVGHHECH